MKFSVPAISTVLVLAQTAIAADGDVLLEKRAFTATTGVPGTAYPRLEIRDLKRNNPDQWNLYLLGMQRFMGMSQSEKMGYYQIAGVHGRPFVEYNDVPGVRDGGYCPHVSNMFLPWHRPYLAHFEVCASLYFDERC
jgi:tyrosinase